MNRRLLVLTLILTAALAGNLAPRLKVGAASSTLSTQDYIDIHHLYGRYAYAADRSDGKAWADNFTPDGEFYGPNTVRDGNHTLSGRQQIAAFLKGPAAQMPAVRHNYSNIVITPTSTGATANAYLVLTNLESTPPSIIGGGYYEDVLVKTGEGWRFKKRSYFATIAKAAQQSSR